MTRVLYLWLFAVGSGYTGHCGFSSLELVHHFVAIGWLYPFLFVLTTLVTVTLAAALRGFRCACMTIYESSISFLLVQILSTLGAGLGEVLFVDSIKVLLWQNGRVIGYFFDASSVEIVKICAKWLLHPDHNHLLLSLLRGQVERLHIGSMCYWIHVVMVLLE
ncbi:hypothetical protein L6452_31426 [Arctium lappa]|uniref:Uncharacterized protein n=1 Tax=Arctium lappa TaxID=4217 RepID=A0ACB8Z0Y6_ARCLA|nr:hypothetical protein L6452_31426 [Arctium lappa]